MICLWLKGGGGSGRMWNFYSINEKEGVKALKKSKTGKYVEVYGTAVDFFEKWKKGGEVMIKCLYGLINE